MLQTMKTMKRVRFYCGTQFRETVDVDRAQYLKIMDRHFPEGYTVITADGVWYSTHETTYILEVLTDKNTGYIMAVASDLRVAGKQEAVLFTSETVKVCLVQ